MLAFQQLGGRCDIVSRAEDSAETWVLRLERGQADGRARTRAAPGPRRCRARRCTLSDLDPDVAAGAHPAQGRRLPARAGAARPWRAATTRSRSSRAGRSSSSRPSGPTACASPSPPHSTLWGRIEFALLRRAGRRAAAARGGGRPGGDDDHRRPRRARGVRPTRRGRRTRCPGQIVVRGAAADARAGGPILRDRDAFPVFVDAVAAIEPAVGRDRRAGRAARSTTQTADRLSDAVRRDLRPGAQASWPTSTTRCARSLGERAGRGRAARRRATAAVTRHDADGATRRALDADARPRPDAAPDPDDSADARRRRRGPPRRADRPQRSLPTIAPDPEPGRGAQPLRRRGRHRPLQRSPRRLPAGQGRRGRAARLPGDARGQGVRRLQQPAGDAATTSPRRWSACWCGSGAICRGGCERSPRSRRGARRRAGPRLITLQCGRTVARRRCPGPTTPRSRPTTSGGAGSSVP